MPEDDIFESDLGLDLLMNPRKKTASSESVSMISSHSDGEDIVSVKSIPIMRRNVVNSRSVSDVDDDNISLGSETIDSQSERSYISKRSAVSRKSVVESLANVVHNSSSAPKQPRMTEDELINAKREILYQFDRLEKKGFKLPRKFTMASSLDEMRQEYERIKRDREIDQSVKFQRKTMITVISGIELLNNYFDPVGAKLDGWSESINENVEDYDDIFEELHDKYKGKAKMAPELRLLMMLGGSAFMFHMTNSMFKTQMPGLDQVLKQNPELAKQFAAATANTMQQNTSSPMMGGLGGMFSSMFGGGGGGGGGLLSGLFGGGGGGGNANSGGFKHPSPPPPAMERPKMKGPSGMDDILREMEVGAGDNDMDDRIEMMSTVTDSEIADDSSINNLLMNKKGSSRRGRKITLDI
jgi:hypothetical protein